MATTKTKALTKAELAKASCGTIGGDGKFYPRHGGNTKLSFNRHGPNKGLAECQGCGVFYHADAVRKLLAAAGVAPSGSAGLFQRLERIEKELDKARKHAIEFGVPKEDKERLEAFCDEISQGASALRGGRKPLTAEAVAEELSHFVNRIVTPEIPEFAEAVTNDHRTLQQQIFGLFMACIERWAEAGSKGFFDLRNEHTVKLAAVMLAAAKANGWYGKVPLI